MESRLRSDDFHVVLCKYLPYLHSTSILHTDCEYWLYWALECLGLLAGYAGVHDEPVRQDALGKLTYN